MGLKTFTINFEKLAAKDSLRGDFRFSHFNTKKIPYKYTYFKNFITKIRNGKDIAKENYVAIADSKIIYPTVNNIKSTGLVLNKVIAIDEEFTGGYYIDDNDIVITRSGTVGLTKCWNKTGINSYLGKNVEPIPSGYLIVSKVNLYKINPIFAEHFLNSSIMSEYFSVFGVGKSQKNIAQGDINYLPFPLITKSTQDQIVARIEPIEKIINELKVRIKPPQEVINTVFAREFGFNENLYNEFGKGMTAGTQIAQNRILRAFKTDFSKLTRSNIVRFSTRFHNPPTRELMDFLDDIDTLQMKDVVETYEKGLQPTYNSDGEIPVVKIANLKNGYIDFSETENITQEAFDNIDHKKKLKLNDIIICATGKGSLGKIDLYEYKSEAITSVDNYILRLNDGFNPLFITYFFRSILGYFQIERDYTGATNQIHLYWDQISHIQIPNISLPHQQKIVHEIRAELENQEEIKQKIRLERNKIDVIIEKAIV